MACVEAPLDQVLPVVIEEVKVTDPPEQKVVGPPVEIVGVLGGELTVMVILVEVAHCPVVGVNV